MGITHNAILPETVYVLPKDQHFKPTAQQKYAPKDHTFALLGGWWYATKTGQSLLGLPPQAVAFAPRKVLSEGKAEQATDHALLRMTARTLLGDATGVRLTEKGVPQAMANWLALPGSGDAYKDFKTWQGQVLKDSFGERRYTELNIKTSDIYPKI